MINKKIKELRKTFKKFKIDAYVIPKNDDFFSEYSKNDKLKKISNFSGSAGFAIISKKRNYLFVDGRYTIQAKLESGKIFKILSLNKIINFELIKKKVIGINPKLFTSSQIKKFFLKNNTVKKIQSDSIEKIFKKKLTKSKPFFSLDKKITGESHKSKIKKIIKFLKKAKSNYLFVSAPENVAWLLNIRGHDNPYSPIPNCRLLIENNGKFKLITETLNVKKLIKEKRLDKKQIIEPENFGSFVYNLNKKKSIIIDSKSCSLFYEDTFKKKLKIIKKEDPIYYFKSLKNKSEIKNMIKAHILDGAALTKFLYWIKNINRKQITEYDAQKKLENFRKNFYEYISPSFNTIAGSGSNGAIVHYRADKKNSKKINKNDIFLCDSGGQYKYGTTDVTRTICFSKPKRNIKDVFTNVLKGHIAVTKTNLKKHYNGRLIDLRARKYLKKMGLDYHHGTGHGVGFYLNVHEGPQGITKFNNIKLQEGMILSNEPGFYKEGKFGIRIENLIYVKKENKKLIFKNLTMAPIEKDLIIFQNLNKDEKNYLFNYHLEVYSKISKYLNFNEKKWLASHI